jgi:hypothetical protein
VSRDDDLQVLLASVVAQQSQLLTRLNSSEERTGKDRWDKLASVSTFLSTVFIAGLGGYFTHVYNDRQAERDTIAKEQGFRIAQAELVQKLMPHLNGTEREKKLSLIAIHLLENSQLAIKLAEFDGTTGSREALEAIKARGNEAQRTLAGEALDRLMSVKANVDSNTSLVDSALRNLDEKTGSAARAALTAAVQEFKAVTAEEAPNRGAAIDKYLSAVGLAPSGAAEGVPWNAAFVSWCFSRAPGGAPFKPSASVAAIRKEFAERNWLHESDGYQPVPGDLFFRMRSSGSGGHAGLVVKYAAGTILTIEGNASSSGPNGEGVVALERKVDGMSFGHVP